MAQLVYAVGDVEVLAVNFNATVGQFNNTSGGFNSVRVDYSVEWYQYDSLMMPDTWPYQWMTTLHLAWAYRDTNNAVGEIEPVYNAWMQNLSGESWPCEFGTCFELLRTDTLHWQIIDSVDTVYVLRYQTRSTGSILLPVPQGDLRLYLVGDARRWDRIYLEDRPAEFCGGFNVMRIPEFTNLNSYFATYPEQMEIHVLEHRDINVPTPEPLPPPLPGIEFDGWLLSDESDGKNWLPVPGDTIGLKFTITSPIPSTGHRFTFLIWDISAWQGRAMNYPEPDSSLAPWHTGHYFDKPFPLTGEDYDFDFWLADPALFDIQVIDTLTQVDATNLVSAPGWDRMPDSLRARDVYPSPLRRSRKSIIARTKNPVTNSFTLRLVAHDYAAHCLVTPFVDGLGKSNFMEHMTTLNERVNHISVPRDEDGYKLYAHNVGDYLADAWEEATFPGDSLRDNWPFANPDSVADSTTKYEDDDHYFIGRNFDGDDLLNFEEYRGFWVASDPKMPHVDTNYVHVRCEPLFKDVFVYFHPALESYPIISFIQDIYPGLIEQLDDSVHAHFTDFSTLFGIGLDSTAAWNKYKSVTFNRNGATTILPPSFIPSDSIQYSNGYSVAQVVSIWPWFDALDDLPASAWLKRYGPPAFPHPIDNEGHGVIPTKVKHICINHRYFQNRWNSSSYYRQNPNNWEADAGGVMKHVIAHEFGHAVGLTHPQGTESTHSIMGPAYWSSDRWIDIPDSFSQQDRARFSIRKQ